MNAVARLIGYDGGMKTKPSEKPLEYLQGMLGNYYKNPAGYAQTVGELDAILWSAHHFWAGLADRETEFVNVRCDLYNNRSAKRIERVRMAAIDDAESVKVVVNLWNDIDRKLNLDTRPEQYDQFIGAASPEPRGDEKCDLHFPNSSSPSL
jgi:hypothetical protein